LALPLYAVALLLNFATDLLGDLAAKIAGDVIEPGDDCDFVIGEPVVLNQKAPYFTLIRSPWGRLFRCGMSVLIWLVGAWLTLNAALVAALWFRRPNPKLRAERRLGIMLSAAKEAGQLSRGQPPAKYRQLFLLRFMRHPRRTLVNARDHCLSAWWRH
jgi:hypothetical protein